MRILTFLKSDEETIDAVPAKFEGDNWLVAEGLRPEWSSAAYVPQLQVSPVAGPRFDPRRDALRGSLEVFDLAHQLVRTTTASSDTRKYTEYGNDCNSARARLPIQMGIEAGCRAVGGTTDPPHRETAILDRASAAHITTQRDQDPTRQADKHSATLKN